jgi:hypothetical protein
MNLQTMTRRDFHPKTVEEARGIAYRWAAQLETYEEACGMVPTSIVRELIWDGKSLFDTIPGGQYGQEFRKRIADRAVERWAISKRRRLAEKYVKMVEGEIAEKFRKEVQKLGLNDSPDQARMMIVMMLKNR